MEYFAQSDIGKYREQNEDFYWSENNLFIVADGMGGHNAGEIASKVAVESFTNFFFLKISKNSKLDETIIKEVLNESLKHANKIVYDLSIKKQEYAGMGTTLTACFINDNKANIIHVGDSRLYIKHLKNFKLLTADHTIVGEMYRDGLITYDEMFNHPLRNYLNNVVGMDLTINADYITYPNLIEGDVLILCSDGLNSMLKDKEIEAVINKYKKPQKITENLIQKANRKGGFDNITVITILI